MTVASSLRFLYIFEGSGLLCAPSSLPSLASRMATLQSPPFYYADIIIIMAKGAKEEQKFAAPISSWWPNETMNKIVLLIML